MAGVRARVRHSACVRASLRAHACLRLPACLRACVRARVRAFLPCVRACVRDVSERGIEVSANDGRRQPRQDCAVKSGTAALHPEWESKIKSEKNTTASHGLGCDSCDARRRYMLRKLNDLPRPGRQGPGGRGASGTDIRRGTRVTITWSSASLRTRTWRLKNRLATSLRSCQDGDAANIAARRQRGRA